MTICMQQSIKQFDVKWNLITSVVCEYADLKSHKIE